MADIIVYYLNLKGNKSIDLFDPISSITSFLLALWFLELSASYDKLRTRHVHYTSGLPYGGKRMSFTKSKRNQLNEIEL